MIGRFAIVAPEIDDSLSQMVETHRAKTRQDYAAILFFGLWGTADCSTEVRLYAAYQHLAANPEDGAAWLETSRTHLEAGETAAALAIVDELQRLGCPNLYPNLYSEDPEVHRAHIMAESGNLDQALEMFDALRSRHDDSPVFHYAVGTVLHEQNDFGAAQAAYSESLEALEAFRLEVLQEELEDELDVDFPAAATFITAMRKSAESECEFIGTRPIELSGFLEE